MSSGGRGGQHPRGGRDPHYQRPPFLVTYPESLLGNRTCGLSTNPHKIPLASATFGETLICFSGKMTFRLISFSGKRTCMNDASAGGRGGEHARGGRDPECQRPPFLATYPESLLGNHNCGLPTNSHKILLASATSGANSNLFLGENNFPQIISR